LHNKPKITKYLHNEQGKREERMKSLNSLIAVALAMVIIGTMGFIVGSHFNNSSHGTSIITSVASNGSIAQTAASQDNITTIYNKVSPAIVEIDVTIQGRGFFRGVSGQGSGFLIDNQGDILTNYHVVEGAASVQVLLKNGTTITAKVLGTDSTDDLAVVKVDTGSVAGITPLQFGDSNSVQPGQMIIAIGSPYGLTDSVTDGIISGLDRSVSGSNMTGMLQIDASINPGNSGGPLLDVNGFVLGINSAIENSANGGIGFAIPSAIVQKALPNLIAGAAN
jgi:S1-C subfamily serine protease